MNCESVVRNTPLFLYGELSLEEEQSFQDHLDQCGECRKAVEDGGNIDTTGAEKEIRSVDSKRIGGGVWWQTGVGRSPACPVVSGTKYAIWASSAQTASSAWAPPFVPQPPPT